MTRWGGERAVSVQIGAVLLLAIFVLALSMYQFNAVPEENKGVEIDHHQEVRTQLTELRNGIVDAPHRGSAGSHTVSLGTGYPSRSFLVNPPPATGTIRTVETNDESYAIEIVNVTPADPDAKDGGTCRGSGTRPAPSSTNPTTTSTETRLRSSTRTRYCSTNREMTE